MAQTGGETALVTGGTGGLGSAVTRELLAGGWRVVVPWVHRQELRAHAAEGGGSGVEEHPRLELVEADLTDPSSAAGAVDRAGPSLRAVVNLVGGFAQGGRVHETPVEDFEAQLRLNLRPAYVVTAAAVPALLAAGTGAVVCVSSRAALRPFAGAAGYITAKAAVLAFVDALDAEYRQDGIRANAIIPSTIDTPATRAANPDADHSRWVAPEDIARTIGYLCSEDSKATSGAHVPVYGRA
jgi:NAD(P)-dependent dehydrogenase (short-subunit alcohol dehydrogenase family)